MPRQRDMYKAITVSSGCPKELFQPLPHRESTHRIEVHKAGIGGLERCVGVTVGQRAGD